jgi:hypothetical protein
MSYALFDCSQFISFDRDLPSSASDFAGFEKLGFGIIMQPNIREAKIDYIERHCMSQIVELFDQEFGADVADWDEDTPPHDIVTNFVDEVERFSRNLGISKITLVFIACASEDRTRNRIIVKEVHFSQIYEGLLEISKWRSPTNLYLTVTFDDLK